MLINRKTILDWDDFDMHEDDEDYIESQRRKQRMKSCGGISDIDAPFFDNPQNLIYICRNQH